MEPRFTAKAQIVVDAPVSSVVGILDEAAIDTRVELLLSEGHLRKVLEALHRDGISVSRPRPSLLYGSSGDERNQEDAPEINILQRNLNAFKERNSRVIGVTFTAGDPELAAEVANRSVTVYFDTLGKNREVERDEKLRHLSAQLPRARAEAEKTDAALQSYRVEAGLMESKRTDMAQDEIVDLTRLLSVARSELLQRQDKMKLLRNFVRTGSNTPTMNEALRNPLVAEALRALPLEARASGDLNEGLGNGADPRASVGAAVQEHLARISDEAERFSSRIRTLEQRLETYRQVDVASRSAEVRLRELERESTVASQLLQRLLQQHVELRSSTPEPLDVRIASPASAPEYSSSPNPILFIPPGITVALVLAGMLAIIRDRMDDKLRSQEEFADALGVVCAGLIPKLGKKKASRAHLDLAAAPFAPFTEAMRAITLSILGQAPTSGGGFVLAVVSSLEGEGKTTVAKSLACYLTLLEKRVLVIDLDFRNPKLETAKSGVLDALAGWPLQEIVGKIPETGVDYLPMQEFRGDPLASFDVLNFAVQVRVLASGYDFVIMDMGPLLGASEAPLFCQAADLILFAVAWGCTRDKVARHALQLIDTTKTFGLLNKVDLRQHAKFQFGDVGEAMSHRRSPRSDYNSERIEG